MPNIAFRERVVKAARFWPLRFGPHHRGKAVPPRGRFPTRLRPLTPADLPTVAAWLTDPAIAQTAAVAPDLTRPAFFFAVEHAGRLIGTAELYNVAPDASEAELGITIAPEARGQGWGGRAVLAVLAQAFAGGVRRVVARIPHDSPTLRYMARLGFTRADESSAYQAWGIDAPTFARKWGRRHARTFAVD